MELLVWEMLSDALRSVFDDATDEKSDPVCRLHRVDREYCAASFGHLMSISSSSDPELALDFCRPEIPGNPKKSIFVETLIPEHNVKTIPLYTFYRHKYGQELLIDVLSLDYVKEGIRRTPVHRESFYQIILFMQGVSSSWRPARIARRPTIWPITCEDWGLRAFWRRPGD